MSIRKNNKFILLVRIPYKSYPIDQFWISKWFETSPIVRLRGELGLSRTMQLSGSLGKRLQYSRWVSQWTRWFAHEAGCLLWLADRRLEHCRELTLLQWMGTTHNYHFHDPHSLSGAVPDRKCVGQPVPIRNSDRQYKLFIFLEIK